MNVVNGPGRFVFGPRSLSPTVSQAFPTGRRHGAAQARAKRKYRIRSPDAEVGREVSQPWPTMARSVSCWLAATRSPRTAASTTCRGCSVSIAVNRPVLFQMARKLSFEATSQDRARVTGARGRPCVGRGRPVVCVRAKAAHRPDVGQCIAHCHFQVCVFSSLSSALESSDVAVRGPRSDALRGLP
jgi:hypothetical protein